MKRALVLSLILALGIGVAGFAGAFTGSFQNTARFTNDGSFDLDLFQSVLNIDYTVSNLVIGATAVFSESMFDDLFFEADGALGAFEFTSMLAFEPQTPSFSAWTNGVHVSIAGVDLMGVFQVDNVGTADVPLIGVGSTLIGQGTVGDVTITIGTFFNMTDYTYYYHFYGYDWLMNRDAYQYGCYNGTTFGAWYIPSGLPFSVQTESCSLAWNGASIYMDMPFTCLDATVYASFTCDAGFDSFGIWLTGIETGIDWLVLEEIDIDFTITSKSVATYWGLAFGEWGCVTPYISLDGGDFSITGITLNALMLEFNYNGVSIKVGEIFDNVWYSWALNGSTYTFGFSMTGDITRTCIYNEDYDEVIGIEIDGDSCCGGLFDVGIYSFFDTSAEVDLFAWQETLVQFTLGIGSNTELYFGGSYLNTGLNFLDIGVTFSW